MQSEILQRTFISSNTDQWSICS